MKMKLKTTTLLGVALLALGGLASCSNAGGGDGSESTSGRALSLSVSGPSTQNEWLAQQLQAFNAKRTSEGKKAVTFETLAYEENEIDSKVTDWDQGPDVYAFASDKIMTLFQAGALATLPNAVVSEYKTTMKAGAMDLYAKFANKYVAYPFDASNGYFLYYDKSVLSETDVQTVEGILAKCNENQQFSYNLEEAFYGIGALFTYGSRFTIQTNPAGVTTEITADFNTENGLKAAKAVVDILRNPYRIKTQSAPTPANKLIATIDGTWNAASYKNQMGENYACAKLPTVTVGGETRTLGSFLGYKMYGVNPVRSSDDAERLALAHEVAQFLVSEEVQISRHATFGSGPTLKSVIESDAVQQDEALVAINAQSEYAVAQTAVPGNVWSAPNTFYAEINELLGEDKTGTVTDTQLEELLEVLNDAIIGSK